MKTTPFDELVHTAARLHSKHPVFQHLAQMLQSVPINVVQHTAPAGHAPIPESLDSLWRVGECLCVFSEAGVQQGNYVSLAACATDWDDASQWELVGLLAFRRPDKPSDFEVIPLLRSSLQIQLVLPELQLTYMRMATGWVWRPALTGFVNAFMFNGVLREMEHKPSAQFEQRLELLGNQLLRWSSESAMRTDA